MFFTLFSTIVTHPRTHSPLQTHDDLDVDVNDDDRDSNGYNNNNNTILLANAQRRWMNHNGWSPHLRSGLLLRRFLSNSSNVNFRVELVGQFVP